MVDVKKEVKLEFTADTSGVKRAMQEFSAYQKEMSQNASKISATGLKSHKDISKIAQKNHKLEELTRGKKALRAEALMQRAVKKTTSEIVKRQRAYGGIVKHVDGLRTRLQKVTQETRKAGGEMRRILGDFFGGGGGGGRGGAGGGGGRAGGGRGRFAGTKGFFKTLLKGIGGMVMGGVMGLLGGAFGLLTGQLSGGYAEREQYGRAYGQLAGTGGRLSALNRQMHFGARMGFGGIEMAQQALPFARATGVVGGGALRTGMALQRASSLNAGEAAGFMGLLTQAGTGFGGKAGRAGKAELVKTLALGVHSGLDRARMPEFFAATTQLVQRQMGATAGRVDSSAAARLLAMLGASGQPGLQGARGGQIAAALDKAIRQPGGGEAGQAFMLQAMGFGKPGGGASYYEALRKQERGVFGAGNLQAMFAESQAQYGGGQAQILALRQLTGLTIDQLEAVRDVVNSNMTNAEKQEALKKIESEAKSIEEQALDEMKEFGDTTRHMAELQNRSIGIGDQIKESVEDIQRVVNELISEFMPEIAAALKAIASTVKAIWEYLQTWNPGELDPTTDIMDQPLSVEEAGLSMANTASWALNSLAAEAMEAVGATEQARASRSVAERAIAEEARRTNIRTIQSSRPEEERLPVEATRIYRGAGRLQREMSEQGYTDRETENIRRLSIIVSELTRAIDSGNEERRDEVVHAGNQLIAAIDEARRSRAGSPPNEDRDSPRTPTRTGRGR